MDFDWLKYDNQWSTALLFQVRCAWHYLRRPYRLPDHNSLGKCFLCFKLYTCYTTLVVITVSISESGFVGRGAGRSETAWEYNFHATFPMVNAIAGTYHSSYVFANIGRQQEISFFLPTCQDVSNCYNRYYLHLICYHVIRLFNLWSSWMKHTINMISEISMKSWQTHYLDITLRDDHHRLAFQISIAMHG